jgi:hypothetical protein
MRILILLLLVSLAGCQSIDLESSIGVDPTDNALICASVNVDPAWSESSATYRRIELPQGYSVTPEQLAELLSACP